MANTDSSASKRPPTKGEKGAPIPSATVLLLRDAEPGFEVFMVVRHHQIDFASGALVFPGGKADPADFDPALRGLTDGAAADPNELAVQLAAIRECFEECGVLLARDHTGHLVDRARLESLDQFRVPMNAGELTLKAFLEAEQLRAAADLLVTFARWVTPTMMPKRFDTWFYLVAAPSDQLALHDGYESVDSVWITPSQAVKAAEDGSRTIIFPTLRNLEKLALSSSTEMALAAAQEQPVVTIEPWTEQREAGTVLCIPTNAGYPITEEPMTGKP